MIVVVELDALAFVVAGMAVGAVARAALAAPDIIFRSPVDVVGDHQIEPAVFVVIEPSRASGPAAFVGDACLCGDVSKSAIAVVVIKNGVSIAGDVEIREPVIVKIADGDSLAVMAFTSDADLRPLQDAHRRSKCTRIKIRMHLDPAPARHYQRQL